MARARHRQVLGPRLVVRRTHPRPRHSVSPVAEILSRCRVIHRNRAAAALTAMIVAGSLLGGGIQSASATLGTVLISNVTIKSVATEHVVAVAEGSTAVGAKVIQSSDHDSASQRWKIYSAAESAGYVYIVNINSGLCLDNRGSTTRGAGLQQYTCVTSDNLKWRLEKVNGYYAIRSKRSGQVADIQGAKQGRQLMQWTYNGKADQLFIIAGLDTTSISTPSPTSTPVSPAPTTSTTAPASAGGVPTSVPGYWWADQSAVPFGSAGCSFSGTSATATAMKKQWDYWDECGGTEVSATAEGLPPAPWGGDHVFRWYKPVGSNDVYQKLNRSFTKDNWPAGGTNYANTGSPADVSGRYIVYQYIPSAKFKLNPGHAWVILSQFKENYRDSSGTWHQDPTWGFGCNNYSGSVMCSLNPGSTPQISLSSLSDRWVKFEYRLYQGSRDTSGRGGRIELYINDKLFDTGYASDGKKVGSAAFSPLSQTLAWIWIAGQYTSTQTTNGVPDYQNTDVTSYVGLSTVLPLP
jgi:hypothetical protein